MKKLGLLIVGFAIGVLATYFYCCNNDVGMPIVAPKGLITPSEAKTLDHAFDTRHQLISDSIVKRLDNRSSWYSITDMRDYLNFAENQAKDLGYTMDGVRIYLGAHPDVKGQVGYTTMFFIPTGNKSLSEGNMLFFNTALQKGGDIPGGFGLNNGPTGNPPEANYPQ